MALPIGEQENGMPHSPWSERLGQASPAPTPAGAPAPAATPPSASQALINAENRKLMETWNATARAYRRDQCIHQMVEEQARKTPDAVALVYGDESLSYRQFNERVNRLAHELIARGVGRESLVGVCLERSIDMVVALHATLKAGGAYVPLDPDYPTDRLVLMLGDAKPHVVIASTELADRLPPHGSPVLRIDGCATLADRSIENPLVALTGDNLAYVIYTSGSTGVPKGAMNTHFGIYNRLMWMQDEYRLTADDRVLQKTPFSFDVSVWEFFWPLMFGAGLVVAEPGGHKDGTYLVETIRKHRVTTIHFVPSMLDGFLEAREVSACTSLKRVICSGEALPVTVVQRFFNRLDSELHNLYGPTEAAVDVTYWACPRAGTGSTVPIGRPIANTQIYILNESGEPVCVGELGELYIGGVGVARGYLNRKELTDAKFVPDPFSREPNRKMYRTGDLARWRADGNIEYLGRVDHQVKIRGFRVELGEIENLLLKHPAVRQAAVLLREDAPGVKRLVAYIVTADPAAIPALEELRAFVKQSLPEYMAPSSFVFLDILPLTSSGKLDRNKLPAPDTLRPHLKQAYVEPTTPIELKLAGHWRSVLKLEQIGINDDFFDLGGDSLRAVDLSILIEMDLGVLVPLATIFEKPTIARLAEALDKREYQVVTDALVKLQEKGDRPPIFFLPGLGGHVLGFREVARLLGGNHPIYGLQPRGLDGRATPHNSLPEMAAYFIEAMRRVAPTGPYHLIGFSAGGYAAYEMAQQLQRAGHEVGLVAMIDTPGPGYPRIAPLPVRLVMHIRHIAAQSPESALQYLRQRFVNILRRFRKKELPIKLPEADNALSIAIQGVAKAWVKAIADHRILPYAGRVAVLRAQGQPDYLGSDYSDPSMGWGKLALGGVDSRIIPGNHIEIIRQPHVRVLADALIDMISAAEKRADRQDVPQAV